MMDNEAAPSYFNGGTLSQYEDYRWGEGGGVEVEKEGRGRSSTWVRGGGRDYRECLMDGWRMDG